MRKLLFLVVAMLGMGATYAQMNEKDMDMMMMTPERTEGLVILGTTGMTKAFAMEQMGEYKGKVSGAFYSTKKFAVALTPAEKTGNAGFFGFAPEIAIVDGITYRMVAPSHSTDNFVTMDKKGCVIRYDLGVDEGTDTITVVAMYHKGMLVPKPPMKKMMH